MRLVHRCSRDPKTVATSFLKCSKPKEIEKLRAYFSWEVSEKASARSDGMKVTLVTTVVNRIFTGLLMRCQHLLRGLRSCRRQTPLSKD